MILRSRHPRFPTLASLAALVAMLAGALIPSDVAAQQRRGDRRGTGVLANVARYNRAEADAISRGLFMALLGREAEARGMVGTSDQIERGGLQSALTTMLGSEEYTRKRASLSAEDLLGQIFRGLLGREPQDGARERFLLPLQQGEEASVIMQILNGDEYTAKLPELSGYNSAAMAACQSALERALADRSNLRALEVDQAQMDRLADGTEMVWGDVTAGQRSIAFVCRMDSGGQRVVEVLYRFR